jgi:hypothetical protein
VSTAAGRARDGIGGRAFRFACGCRLNVFHWAEGRFGSAISAEAERAALAHVCAEVHRLLAKGVPLE